jgi:hypothetical protein
MKTLDDLLSTIEWSPPLNLNTRNGPRRVKKAPITPQFWSVWETDRDRFKALLQRSNATIGKFREVWQLTWWSREDLTFGPLATEHSAPAPEPEPEVVLPPLKFLDTLYQFQQTSVQLALVSMAKYNRVLLGHSTGVGKTFCALGIARELGKKIAVMCPLVVTTDWWRAAKMMGVEVYDIQGWERVKTSKTKMGKWYNDKKEQFVWTIPEDTILIADEIHRAKGFNTQNAFLIRDSVVQNVPCVALSATIADDPTKLSALGQFLGLHTGGKDFYRFIQSHGCTKTRFGFQFRGSHSILKKLHSRIYPDRGNRLRHSDLGDQFPETLIKARAFDMATSKEIAAEYDDLQLRIEELRMQENFAANVLAEQMRARQRIELFKCASVASLARDYVEEGCSVFIAVAFTETREWLMKELKTTCSIHGGQNELERRGNIDSFQRNKSKIIIGQIAACREGLNLHDTTGEHPRVSLIMPDPSIYNIKQVLGRVHRAGGKTKSVQYLVYSAGVSIEESICEKLDEKLKRLDTLMDGDVDPTISFRPNEQKSLDIPTE